ncbi:hypothetical protein EV702DRAFT_1197424 [Suillus placidus]|uniref:Endonuclease/exonuclease/phosphatase domain-containing protein n=1 Tax=Suillus placidus TaxID=48579 RepID=A0A9P7D3H4_9AGAM|nr:hypothetical protein EV702DRAFT_1197424 [Suillus placidus]
MEESDSEEVHLPARLISCPLMVPTALMERSCQELATSTHFLPASFTSSHPLLIFVSPSHMSAVCFSVLTCFAFAFFVSLLPYTSASSAPSTLRAFTINSNGLADPMKCNSISRAISDTFPHVWVINETKSAQSAAHRLHLRDYNTFEYTGVPNSHSTSAKWGVIVGMKRSLSAQHVHTDLFLQGRVVIVDLIIPSLSGRGFPHRILGVYAPWDPGVDVSIIQQFWFQVSQLCLAATHSWSLYGDCNATTSDCEVTTLSANHATNRQCFQNFLYNARGIDLWSDHADRRASDLFTCHGASAGRSIIDRAVHSHHGCLAGEVDIAPTFNGATDHRPIQASLVLTAPGLPGSQLHYAALPNDLQPSYPHCDLYPKRNEQYCFTDFATAVDRGIDQAHDFDETVTNDSSFSARFDALSTIFADAASHSFEKPNSRHSSQNRVTSLTIRLLVRESQRIGCLVFAAWRSPHLVDRLAHTCSWVHQYLDTFAQLPLEVPESRSLLDYLLSMCRALAKL